MNVPVDGSICSGSSPTGLARAHNDTYEVLGPVETALQDQVVHQPETAEQEGALVAGQAVGRAVVQVPVEQAVTGGQAFGDGGGGGHHAADGGPGRPAAAAARAGWRPGRRRRRGARSGTAPSRPRTESRMRPRSFSGGGAPRGDRPGQAQPPADRARPVQGHLAHRGRVGEGAAFAAHLPDALVRLPPPVRAADSASSVSRDHRAG